MSFELPDFDLPMPSPARPLAGIDSRFDDFSPQSNEGSGLGIRQFTGGIVVDGNEPSTAEYQAALIAVYASDTPRKGDLITLRVASGTRLVARFWILENDTAASNATVAFTIGSDTYYALNISYAPLEQIIGAFQDYLAGPGSGEDPDGRDLDPESTAPFSISVNGIYDTDPNGFLIPPSGNPSISVVGGTVQVTDDITATATSPAPITIYGFPPSDNLKVYIHIYLKVTVSLLGPQGTSSSATAVIEHRSVSTPGVAAVSADSFVGTNKITCYTIGVVTLARKGNRRFARITQSFAGDLELHPEGTGSSTPVSGVNLATDVRRVILTINGEPYNTYILTGPLVAVT